MGAEEYVESLPMWAKKKNTVQQVREFLDLLQEEAPAKENLQIPIVHVAGTNGKGSVCAYLTQAFLDSGLHVGTFISPHLVDVKERILLDNVPVDGARFAEACEKVRELAERICVSKSAVAKWETDGGIPDRDNLFRLSKAINISVSDLHLIIRNSGKEDADYGVNITGDVIAILESHGYKVQRPGEGNENNDQS